MDGNIHVYEQRSSFRAIKGESPGKQIFPCRGCMAPPMWSQCCHFLLATCPQQHICFCFSFYLPVLTMCQRGEICSGLFRKLCCPQLKKMSHLPYPVTTEMVVCMSADTVEWQNYHGQLTRRQKSSILQTSVTWWPLTTSQAFTLSLKHYIHP